MWLEKLNTLRKQSGMSLDEISLKSGVPKGTLSKITSGITKSPSIETIRAIMYSMGYTLDDLDDAPKRNPLTLEELKHIKKYRNLDGHGKEVINSILDLEIKRIEQNKEQKTDFLTEVISMPSHKLPLPLQPSSAGTGDYIDDDSIEWIEVYNNPYTLKADILQRVHGDSMEPEFYNNDLLLVREQPAVDIGEVGIFFVNGDRYVKTFCGDHLESLNPIYDDIELEDKEFICVGKVICKLDDSWIVN